MLTIYNCNHYFALKCNFNHKYFLNIWLKEVNYFLQYYHSFGLTDFECMNVAGIQSIRMSYITIHNHTIINSGEWQ